MHVNLIFVTVFSVAAFSAVALANEAVLEGNEWVVAGDHGKSARSISFAGSGKIFGFGGCNRFAGTYEQHGNRLSIGPLASTRMACAVPIMQKENEFFGMLGKVRGATAEEKSLLFLDETGGDLVVLTRRNAGAGGSGEN